MALPDGNGFSFCREELIQTNLPILFLTARDSELDRLLGLELGRGDYLTKPFSPRELTIRLRNLLFRSGDRHSVPPARNLPPRSPAPRPCLEIDPDRASILINGLPVDLSALEFRIFEALVLAKGRILTREHLLNLASAEPASCLDRTIDSHIKNIRTKFRANVPLLRIIETRRGFGYCLAPGFHPWTSTSD